VFSTVSNIVGDIFRSNLERLQREFENVNNEYGRLMQQKDIDLDNPQIMLKEQKLVYHLNQLVATLVKEEEEQKAVAESADRGSSTGPCFEYLLKANMIDRLCVIGLPDRPPGMRTLITRTIYAILSYTEHPIIPHMNVHQPLCQLIELCDQRGDLDRDKDGKLPDPSDLRIVSPLDKEIKGAFVLLLWRISMKISVMPSLAEFFFDHRPHSKPKFVLFTSLAKLLNEMMKMQRELEKHSYH